ncbi:ThiF family adenylyltransferase [Acidobacteria bacterium AH-259-D05]|nr:ThiF family adenylyltransferase [Acidobacteria bacterium AH-259-D05]
MIDRYSRQILFSGIGEAGQEKIRAAQVVLIGCGALGSVSSEMLTRAGVGKLTLIDRDFVEESNLQRQSLFTEKDVQEGVPKAAAAERALRAINSDVEIKGLITDVTWENIERLCQGNEVIVDGTDNFETRFLINDLAVKEEMPWIYGACVGSYGVAFAFEPGISACLQCLFEQPPEVGTTETCDTSGILAPVVHAVAAFQVTQVLKILTGQSPSTQILQVDVWRGTWQTLAAEKARSRKCPCCRQHDFRFLEGKENAQITRLCGRDAVQVSPQRKAHPDFQNISRRLNKSAQVDFNQYMMRIRIEGYEIALFADGRSIIRGTEDVSEARAVYAKYIGS